MNDSADTTDHDDTAATHDVIVVGGGPVGENVAQYVIESFTAESSVTPTVALVEAELVGGECSYWACIPSKALLRPLTVAGLAADLGGATSAPRLDVGTILSRRTQWVSDYHDEGQVSWAESAGITVVRGHARLSGDRQLQVTPERGNPRQLRARHAVVLATGSVPNVPDPYIDVHPWGSRDATGIREVPGSVAIIGGGVVACEAATWLAGLGAEVTMLVRGDRLLDSADPFAGEAVADGLRAVGVTIRFGTSAAACDRPGGRDTGVGRIHGGPVTLRVRDEDLVVDEVLVATGRRPRLDDVGLDSVGLTEQGVLQGRLPDWLYVVGDASGDAPLTHWGKYRARELGEQLAAEVRGMAAPARPSGEAPVPQVVFTDPQVATVGRTETQARHDGVDVVTARVPFNAVAGASLVRDHVAGTAQLVVDRSTATVVGATFVGPEAGELLHAATIAITAQVPVPVLRRAVPAFPTASELWLRLVESLPQELRH